MYETKESSLQKSLADSSLAQLAEQETDDLEVMSSNPTGGNLWQKWMVLLIHQQLYDPEVKSFGLLPEGFSPRVINWNSSLKDHKLLIYKLNCSFLFYYYSKSMQKVWPRSTSSSILPPCLLALFTFKKGGKIAGLWLALPTSWSKSRLLIGCDVTIIPHGLAKVDKDGANWDDIKVYDRGHSSTLSHKLHDHPLDTIFKPIKMPKFSKNWWKRHPVLIIDIFFAV